MAAKRYWVSIPDEAYYRQMIKCQAACPVLTDARGYVTAVARGELALGYQIAHDPNPLSTICGRICGAPCEEACRRGAIGRGHEPVAIRPLKRVLTERFGPEADPGTAEVPKLPDGEQAAFLSSFGIEPQNLIPLCLTHHKWSDEVAPHSMNVLAVSRFRDWVAEHRPKQFGWWAANEHSKNTLTAAQLRDKYEADIERCRVAQW